MYSNGAKMVDANFDCRLRGGTFASATGSTYRKTFAVLSVTAIAAAAVSISRRWFRSLTLVGFTSSPILVDRKSTRLNSSHLGISYAVFCLKKKKKKQSSV